MPRGDAVYSRPEKIDHAQTVLYEIDLLRFAKTRLEEASTEGDEWVYLEDFLLHYRNLIEFFGKPLNQARAANGDLSILRPERVWPAHLPDKAVLDSMTRLDLWERYDTRDNPQAISKYLHHCTEQRVEGRSPWQVNAMYEELRPTIEKFESLLPEFKPATRLLKPRRSAPGSDGNSTTSTRTLNLGQLHEK
jgi:hypothetical protein